MPIRNTNSLPENRYRVFQDEATFQQAKIVWQTQPAVFLDAKPYLRFQKFRSLEDQVFKNFRERLRSGEVLIGEMEAIKLSQTDSGNTRNIQRAVIPAQTQYNYDVVGGNAAVSDLGSGWHSFPPIDGALALEKFILQAKQNVLSNIDKPDFDLLEDILTYRQTLDLLKDPLKIIRETRDAYYKALKLAKRQKFKSLPVTAKFLGKELDLSIKTASNHWLFYRFAISPALKSASDIYESLQEQQQNILKNLTIRKGSKVKLDIPAVTDTSIHAGYPQFPMYRKVQWDGEVRVGVFYQLRKDQKRSLARKYGTRFKDLPAGFWAAIPYSFMIDRMVNISKLSKALMNLLDPNINIKGAYLTIETKLDIHYEYPKVDVTWGGQATQTMDESWVHVTSENVSRIRWNPNTSDLKPSVDVKGLISDSTKIVDLVTLVLQRR